MKNKNGFTLAEVLVAISVIGIIAAITIPSLLKNYQIKVSIARAKKARYEVSEVAGYIQARYPKWRNKTTNEIRTEFNNYLKDSSSVDYQYRTSLVSGGNKGCGKSGDGNKYLVIAATEKDKTDIIAAFCANKNGGVSNSTICNVKNFEKNKKADSGCATITN